MYLLDYFRLSLIQAAHGRFSLQYWNQYQRMREKYPHSSLVCPEMMSTETLTGLKKVMSEDRTDIPFSTGRQIQFSFTEFGKSRKEVLLLRGNPDSFGFVTSGVHNLCIYSYRSNYLEQSMRIVFIFFDDEFFCGEYIFGKKQGRFLKTLLDELRRNFRIDPPSHLSSALRIKGYNGLEEVYVHDDGLEISTTFFSRHNPVITDSLPGMLN